MEQIQIMDWDYIFGAYGLRPAFGEHIAPGLAVTCYAIDGDKVSCWTITHVPSGKGLGGIYTFEDACERARKLAAEGNWDQPFKDATEVKQGGIDTDQVREILKQGDK